MTFYEFTVKICGTLSYSDEVPSLKYPICFGFIVCGCAQFYLYNYNVCICYTLLTTILQRTI